MGNQLHHLLLVGTRHQFQFNLGGLGLIVKQLSRHVERYIDEVGVIAVLLQLEDARHKQRVLPESAHWVGDIDSSLPLRRIQAHHAHKLGSDA